MLAVLEVDLKVLDRHAGTWGVELAGTVVAADARQPFGLGLRGQRRVLEHAVREQTARDRVDHGVPHRPLKRVVRVRPMQAGDAGREPGWWWWLRGELAGIRKRVALWGN